jgi:acyl-CoA thioesterase
MNCRRPGSPGTDTHPFDSAVHLDAIDTDVRCGRTHPEWANMIGPFGGITVAVIVHAIETHPDHIGEPPALTANFAAPITDGDFDVSLRAARTNRTNQHWIIQLSHDGVVKTTASAVFAIRRNSWAHTEALPPSAPPPEAITHSGRGVLVAWEQLYDRRSSKARSPSEKTTTPAHPR